MSHRPPRITVIEQPSRDAHEAARARWWRVNIVKLSRAALGERIGYSPKTIDLFERGYNYNGKPLAKAAWKKYSMACCAVHWGAASFNWENGRVDNG